MYCKVLFTAKSYLDKIMKKYITDHLFEKKHQSQKEKKGKLSEELKKVKFLSLVEFLCKPIRFKEIEI